MKIFIFITNSLFEGEGLLFQKSRCKPVTPNLWKRNEKNVFIYGHKCTATPNVENFITDILKSISNDLEIELSLFSEWEIKFIIHAGDIGMRPKNDYLLNEIEIENNVLKYNPEIRFLFNKPANANQVFVFQHDSAGVIDCILNQFECNANIESLTIEDYLLKKLETIVKKNSDLVLNKQISSLFFYLQYILLFKWFFGTGENLSRIKTDIEFSGLTTKQKLELKDLIINCFIKHCQEQENFIEDKKIEKLKRLNDSEKRQYAEVLINEKIETYSYVKENILKINNLKDFLVVLEGIENENEGIKSFISQLNVSKLPTLGILSDIYNELGRLLDFDNSSRNVNKDFWIQKDLYEHRSLKHFILDLQDFIFTSEIDEEFKGQIFNWIKLSTELKVIIEKAEDELSPRHFINEFPDWIKFPLLDFWRKHFRIEHYMSLSIEKLKIVDSYIDTIQVLINKSESNDHSIAIKSIVSNLINESKIAKKSLVSLFASIRYQDNSPEEDIKTDINSNSINLPSEGIVIVIDDELGNTLEGAIGGKGDKRRRIFGKHRIGIEYSRVKFLSGQKFERRTNKVSNESVSNLISQIQSVGETVLCFLIDLYFKEGEWNYERGEVTQHYGSKKYGLEIANSISGIRAFEDIPVFLMSEKDEISRHDKDLYLNNVRIFLPKTDLNPQLFAFHISKYQNYSLSSLLYNKSEHKLAILLKKCLNINKVKHFDPDTCHSVINLDDNDIDLLILYYIRKLEEQLKLSVREIDEKVFNILESAKGKAFTTTKDLAYIIKYTLVTYPDVTHFTVDHFKLFPYYQFIEPEFNKHDAETDVENFKYKIFELFIPNLITFDNGDINWSASGQILNKIFPEEFTCKLKESTKIKEHFRKHIYELRKKNYPLYKNLYTKYIKDNTFKDLFILLESSNNLKHKVLYNEIMQNSINS